MPDANFLDRNYHVLRRLHSLTGIVPIGVFLCVHLLTNSSPFWGSLASRGEFDGIGFRQGGVAYFQKEVSWINTEVPHLLLIELTLWIAIGFHSVLGVYYAMTGKSNTARYAYQANWRYRLQRISGYVGIFFIFYHVATLRWGWTFLIPGETAWTHQYATSTLARALRGGDAWTAKGLAVAALYYVGVSLLVFHFANGLWTAAITWGLTISAKSQRRWGFACFGLGASLMAMAWMALIAASTVSPVDARQTEEDMRTNSLIEHRPEGTMTARGEE